MKEADVKRSLREYLKKIGAYQFWPVKTAFGSKTNDCIVCHDGRFFLIECKAPGKKPAKYQVNTAGEVFAAGGVAFTEDSIDLCTTRLYLKP